LISHVVKLFFLFFDHSCDGGTQAPHPKAQAGRKRHTRRRDAVVTSEGAGGTHCTTPCQKENSCQRAFYIGTRPSPKLKKLTDGVN
jgi:hypothetical protein